jgi:hypothetical protein
MKEIDIKFEHLYQAVLHELRTSNSDKTYENAVKACDPIQDPYLGVDDRKSDALLLKRYAYFQYYRPKMLNTRMLTTANDDLSFCGENLLYLDIRGISFDGIETTGALFNKKTKMTDAQRSLFENHQTKALVAVDQALYQFPNELLNLIFSYYIINEGSAYVRCYPKPPEPSFWSTLQYTFAAFCQSAPRAE